MPAKKQYTVERVGQMDFFDNYRVPYNDDASVLVDNTDGVYHGNILEFKLNINNTGKVLFQAIKYLSKMRIKGESVPARILLIDLNATKVYVYPALLPISRPTLYALTGRWPSPMWEKSMPAA